MNSTCSQCQKPGGRNSSYFRKADGVNVTQFRCVKCKRFWTDLTDNLEKRQRLRSINQSLCRILNSNVSMRRAAKILNIDRKTVERRVSYLAQKAKAELTQHFEQTPVRVVREVHLDELITFEHTRCKPLAVCMAVSESREILSFKVSQMAPIGKNLRKISFKKYGPRPDFRRKGFAECLDAIRPLIGPETVFKSDEEPFYRSRLQRAYPQHQHFRFPSKRAVIAGQGELKDRSFDPIFAINHTFAMLRANLARLIRRTWAHSKTAKRLEEFIQIYMAYHNLVLLPESVAKKLKRALRRASESSTTSTPQLQAS